MAGRDSSTTTTVTLLGAWLAINTVTAVVVAQVFDIDWNSTNLGGPFWSWALGYVVGWVVYMRAQRGAGQLPFPMPITVLLWLVASLLPFATDGLAVRAVWYVVPCAAVGLAIAAPVIWAVTRASDLRLHGVSATGTVTRVVQPRMNTVVNNVYIKRTLVLSVDRHDGTPAYPAKLSELFMLGEIPNVGDSIALFVDPKNPKRMMAQTDATSGSADDSPSATVFPPTVAPSDADDVPTALAHLAQLHKSGDLTDQEYEAAKAKVLG